MSSADARHPAASPRTTAVAVLGVVIAATAAACAASGPATSPASATQAAVASPALHPASQSAASATPAPLPPYAIDALRTRPRGPVSLHVGASLGSGAGYTKHRVTWTSMGATMTGVLDTPTVRGPSPVVIVNHGYVAPSQYHVGQDSSKYADPLAAAGFLTVSPDYPGYAGSGPSPAAFPNIIGQAMSDMDLMTALATLPQADVHRIAVAGHSNGGGVALILLAADDRVRAAVLYAPVSSNMLDNARRLWADPGATGELPEPIDDAVPYLLMSPQFHLPRNGPPTLLMQGSNDEDIPEAWTLTTTAALQAAGIRTQFVSFPGAMHNFQGADLARANRLAVEWIRSAIGG